MDSYSPIGTIVEAVSSRDVALGLVYGVSAAIMAIPLVMTVATIRTEIRRARHDRSRKRGARSGSR
jgi:hypothetical protein